MSVEEEFAKLTLEDSQEIITQTYSTLEIKFEIQTTAQKTPEKKSTPSKKSTPKKLSLEDEEKLKNIKIEKTNTQEIFQELKEFFSTLKKNYNSTQSDKLKEIFKKYPDFKFSNIFIHAWFKYLYSDLILSDQQTCFCFNYRTSFVQQMMEDVKSSKEQVVDHQAFSAFLKVLFGSLKYSKSCKLYNILFAIFVFNSSINLKVKSKEENSQDAKYEKKVNDTFRKLLELKPTVEKGKFLYEEYRDTLTEEMIPFLESKLKPSLLNLLPYLKCSSSACSMIGWAFNSWNFDDPMSDWKTSYQTILKYLFIQKKTEEELRNYLFKRKIDELFIIESFSFTDELKEFEISDLHLRLFITLSKRETLKNIKEILVQFENL
jgi:hypothetical protein